jgi:nitroreductase
MTDNNYDILKTICQNRKSTRRYSNEAVPDEVIQKIIDIAKTSPYASGLKNWDIQVVNSKDDIEKIAECVKNKASEMAEKAKEDLRDHFLNYTKNFTFFESAPAIIILTFRISPIMQAMMGSNVDATVLQWERDNFTKSISCAAMLVLLAAESLNLGSCYMTGPLIAQNEIMIIINSKPGREIGAIIPIGYKEK